MYLDIEKHGLVGTIYQSKSNNNNLIICIPGIPQTSSHGLLNESTITKINTLGFDIYIPEYYGYCRSCGEFKPSKCIKTVDDAYNFFLSSNTHFNTFKNGTLIFDYNQIYICGTSFGCSIIAQQLKLNKSIHTKNIIGLFAPVLEFKNLNTLGYTEQTIEGVNQLMRLGYKNLYRGRNKYKQEWDIFLNKKHNLSDNYNFFITHSKDDETVHYSRTKALLGENKHIVYYDTLGHGKKLFNTSIIDYAQCIRNKKV